ncbi:hypothetical protein AM493_19180 [Flavobacterium akiainvivens]|uniref:LysM domain-containing protein n=2 Tax=Flavobacterium akiainvivens TaxID=1202724 RepID=A0A0M8MKA8_9FLAO|nr:hypothetical protein AM493_19180 [Flavobacterium akiainvivens]
MGIKATAQDQSDEGATTITTTTTTETTTVKKKNAREEENIPTVAHTVQMGETVMLICKKYIVAPDDIYKLNPEAVDGISPGMVLRVPSEKKVDARPAKSKPVDTSVTSRTAKRDEE